MDRWVSVGIVVRNERRGDGEGDNGGQCAEREKDSVGELDDSLGRHGGGGEVFVN